MLLRPEPLSCPHIFGVSDEGRVLDCRAAANPNTGSRVPEKATTALSSMSRSRAPNRYTSASSTTWGFLDSRIDDHPTVFLVSRHLLGSAGFEVAGETGNAAEAVRVAKELCSDLVDLRLGEDPGIEAAGR